MHARTHRPILITALLVAAAPAFAGNAPKEPHKPRPQPEPAPYAAAASAAESQADAAASARAAAEQRQGQFQSAEATGGQGIGTVEGDTSRFRSTAIALSVPGATAAPAVIDACIEHSRGWSAGMGVAARTGGTKLQERCMERQHCLAIADRYHAMGLVQAAVDQLASCGGVKDVTVIVSKPSDPEPPTPPVDLDEYVKRDELARLATKEELDRAFRLGVSK